VSYLTLAQKFRGSRIETELTVRSADMNEIVRKLALVREVRRCLGNFILG
jgi:hypothetical protein